MTSDLSVTTPSKTTSQVEPSLVECSIRYGHGSFGGRPISPVRTGSVGTPTVSFVDQSFSFFHLLPKSKLVALPLAVYGLARLIALPATETQAVTLLASLPVGANVYLMAREFGTLSGPVATSLVLTTALAAATTPLVLGLVAGGPTG